VRIFSRDLAKVETQFLLSLKRTCSWRSFLLGIITRKTKFANKRNSGGFLSAMLSRLLSCKLTTLVFSRRSTLYRTCYRKITKFARNCRTVDWTAISSRMRTAVLCAPVRRHRVILRQMSPLRTPWTIKKSVLRSSATFTANLLWTKTTAPFASASHPAVRRFSDAGRGVASVSRRINAAVPWVQRSLVLFYTRNKWK